MGLSIREFDVMVDETLQRIIDSNIGVTNTNPGSVIRTLVESVLAESDIQYYQIKYIYDSLGVDTASGDDLDRLVSLLGVVRKSATKATGMITFRTTEISESDIQVQYAQMVSTRQDQNGNIVEFIVTDTDAKLSAGIYEVDVNIEAVVPGNIYIPIGLVSIMNTPIVGIESVFNKNEIYGGTDDETDESLRIRAKNALSNLGKGTSNSLRSALLNITDVVDVMIVDMANGVGTADAIVVTASIPPSSELDTEVRSVINVTKSAGINISVVYPTVVEVDVDVTTTSGDSTTIGDAIIGYVGRLGISTSFIINQMERAILNACDIDNMDISTNLPVANVDITSSQVVRAGIITVNGVIYSG